jgi:hypothetical protein
MDELLARKRLLEGSETGRRAEESRWQVQIQPIRESGSSLNLSNNWELKEVSLEMTVMDAGRERRIDFKTLRLTRKINP